MTYSIRFRFPSNPFEAANYIDRFSRKASFLNGNYEISDVFLDGKGFESMNVTTDNKNLADSLVELIAEINGYIEEVFPEKRNEYLSISEVGMN